VKNFKSISFYSAQSIVSGILIIAIIPIISHHIIPKDFGEFVLAQIYTGFLVGIANLGLLLGYERNFFLYEKSKRKSAKLFSSVFSLVFINILILFFFIFYFEDTLISMFALSSKNNNLLLLLFSSLSLFSLSQYYLTYMKNSGHAKRYFYFMVSNSFMHFSLTIIFLNYFEASIMSLVYSSLFSNLFLFFSLFLYHLKNLHVIFDSQILKEVLKISLPLSPRLLLGPLSSQIDKILLGMIGSSGLVGIYHMGQTIAVTTFQFMTSIERTFQPVIYRKLFSKQNSSNSSEIGNFLVPYMYLSIFFASIVTLFSKEFIELFMPNSYLDSRIIVSILTVYYAMLFFGKVNGTQIIFLKKTIFTSVIAFVGVGLNFTLNLILIPYWGIIGASIATLFSGVLVMIITFFIAQKSARINFNWRFTMIFYLLFAIATLHVITDYIYQFNNMLSLSIKFFLVLAFVLLGLKMHIFNYMKK